MTTKHSKYYIFPGKQQDPVIVPTSYQPIFFEGVQSIDGTANATDMQHGQHGSMSNVIEEKSFDNISGTVNIKNLGHMWPCLRAMCNQDPDHSFLFDPAYLTKVDMYVNVNLKDRSKVAFSRWYADFAGSYSGSDPLDDVSTADIEYSCTRLLIFEGYQIYVDVFPDTVQGEEMFVLTYPAVVPPVMNNVVVRTPDGVASGKQLHEYCPIQYALRVWVGDTVLTDPDQATIVTTSEPNPIVTLPNIIKSRLYLKDPIAKSGQMVKVMYLIPGDVAVAQGGVSKAPIMVSGLPHVDDPNTPAAWDKKIFVTLSKTATDASLASLVANASDLKLVWGPDATNKTYTWVVSAIDVTKSITGNAFEIEFSAGGITVYDAVTGTTAPGSASDTWPIDTPATLRYDGDTLRDSDDNMAPSHVIRLEPWNLFHV